MDISLPYRSSAGSSMPMWLSKDFDILRTPSKPSSSGMVRMHCPGFAVLSLQVTADHQVEFLIGAAELDVGVEHQ